MHEIGSIEKDILQGMMEGRQGRGRTQTPWMESIKKYTGSSMVALHDWQMAELEKAKAASMGTI